MKKVETAAWSVIAFMTLAAVVSIFFLPDQIAVQWNFGGVSNTASKWIVFAFPALGLLCAALHKSRIPKNTSGTENNGSFAFGVLIALIAEIVIIVSAFI